MNASKKKRILHQFEVWFKRTYNPDVPLLFQRTSDAAHSRYCIAKVQHAWVIYFAGYNCNRDTPEPDKGRLTNVEFKRMRKDIGYTQQGLADLIGLTKQRVSQIERHRGLVSLPTSLLITRIWQDFKLALKGIP